MFSTSAEIPVDRVARYSPVPCEFSGSQSVQSVTSVSQSVSHVSTGPGAVQFMCSPSTVSSVQFSTDTVQIQFSAVQSSTVQFSPVQYSQSVRSVSQSVSHVSQSVVFSSVQSSQLIQ